MNSDEQDAPKRRGAARMKELAPTYERDRAEIERAILAEVGEPGMLHKIAAEAMSSAIVGARRKRARGQSDNECLKLVAQLARAFGLRPAPGTGPSAPTIADYLASLRDEATE